jgi:DNA polymerase-4
VSWCERYRCISAEVFAIYERFTTQIEKESIDKACLAVPSGKGFETARKIRKTVKQELGLPISAGVSINKLLAKWLANWPSHTE